MNSMNQDKLGCYRVGNLKFYSKLEAIEHMEKTGIHLHWDFNEAVFDCYDWTIEPNENILELYRQRAQQLRDKYDYIALIYSGGADSETVLQSFVNNDIKLDEVASYINYEATGSKTSFLNREIFENAIPRVSQLQATQPWIKHRIIDLTKLQLDYFNSAEAKFDWIYSVNMLFNSNCVSRESLGTKIPDWRHIIDSGKKLCLLWGHDKPRIFYENNRLAIRFIDLIDNGPTVKSFAGELPYSDELFYWTPDLPNMIIKQGHLIKNYFDYNLSKSPYITTQKTDLAFKIVNDKKYWLSSDGLHSIIYPNYCIETLSAAKPVSTIISPRDTWFFNLEDSNLAKQVWKMGVTKLWQQVPDYWKNQPSCISKGLKACWSKFYFLEKEAT
jgi:hypothetical protein